MTATATIQRPSRGTVSIEENRCKGCGFCIEFCPTGALQFSESFNQLGYHFPVRLCEIECTGCNQCGSLCPDFAIFGYRNCSK